MNQQTPFEQLSTKERHNVFLEVTTLLIVPAAAIILAAVIALGFAVWHLENIASDTNNILNIEVQEKDQQIAQQAYIINEQAAPAVIHLLGMLQEAGIKTPIVLLNPRCPPFDPTVSVPPRCNRPPPSSE